MSKRQITPTAQEIVMDHNEIIVSKTDLKGRITYGNTTFLKYAGFAESELIGTQHNIIRHPDMPRGVFKLFWDTLQRGDEIFAFVKNISMDGSFYWVLANVTPSVNEAGERMQSWRDGGSHPRNCQLQVSPTARLKGILRSQHWRPSKGN